MDEDAIPFGLAPKEALAWFRAKGFIFGFSWQDVWHEEHGRGFTVAKAMTRDVLETIREAVDRAIAEGQTLEQFQKDLRPLLEKLGWWGKQRAIDPATGQIETVQLGSPRRLKTIFQTNMRTSYAAGRWERIQRNKRAFPLLEYVSVMDGREREEHHAWHATVLPVDDPWWETHYPPNGWNCRCVVKPVSRGQAERRGLKVTKPRAFSKRQWINKRTGEVQMIEKGLDAGWAYHVGKARHDGLTPGPMDGDGIAAMSALSETDEMAAFGFLSAFGMASVAAQIAGLTYLDAGGWWLAIAASWFQDDEGRAVLPAGLDAAELGDVADVIRSPAEIRWLWITSKDAPAQLVRRYFGPPDAAGAVMVVDIARWWRARRVSAARAAAMRKGVLAWSPELAIAAYNPSQPRNPKGTAGGGRFRATGAGAIGAAVPAAMRDRQSQALVPIGKVESNAPADIIGFDRAVPHETIRKVLAKHGVGGTGGDKVKIRRSDFRHIPAIVAGGTMTEKRGGSGNRRLTYRHTVGGREFVYVELVGGKTRRVQAKSLYVPNK